MVDISNINNINLKNLSEKETSENSNDSVKKIRLIYLKQGKAKRTYIYNLEYYITDQKKLTSFVKKLQTELATGMVNDKDEYNISRFGFNGKHGDSIKNKLINELGIQSDKIECSQIC